MSISDLRTEFIYVFDEESKRKLISANYVLLKEDKNNSIYIFADKQEVTFENFSLTDMAFIRSNTLTF